MTRGTPVQHALARRLLAYEVAGRRDAESLATAAEAACEKLHARIALVLGEAGFCALFTRALQLASADFPFLATVEVTIESKCALPGLRERIAGQDLSQVGEGLAAVIANFIWLLISFVGEGLALMFLGQAFPEVVHGGTATGSTEADRGEKKR